jgi:hypothetical protein
MSWLGGWLGSWIGGWFGTSARHIHCVVTVSDSLRSKCVVSDE